MHRISVIGNSGSGKSTLVRKIAEMLNLQVLELDGIFHQAGWTPLSADEFQARVRAFVAADRWIVDGNYVGKGVAQIVWPVADTIIWLDLPRKVVMRQIIHRTLRRMFTGEALWNGNRETFRKLVDTRPDENVILWAWTAHEQYRTRYEALLADGSWSHLRVIRLRSRSEVESFITSLPGRASR